MAFLAVVALIVAGATVYLAYRSPDFRKFLAGAFFVSAGIQFYLYFADVSVPLLGTDFVLTPRISAGRAVIHSFLFLVCLYSGFMLADRPRKLP